ncbi:hypothetical protein ACFO5R_10600 [Halosolutus amylolyticus]|uniref:Uncharacterized protein n=1 Tax=Halosolutus amylolyticus TaxID=2932267 RepID=A0ABD5PPY5_9EURY|nr:hypothetical protein [Halosolutus amylolyticus]
MSATFTDGDVEKRVENANGETIGVVTAIDDDVAHVEPRSGVMDSIRATLGWGRAHDDTFAVRDEAVEEITDETIRLEIESLDRDDASVPENDRRGSGAGPDRGGETDDVGSDPPIDDHGDGATPDPTAADERDDPTASIDGDPHGDGLEREPDGTDDGSVEPSMETDAELQDELDRGTKIEPPADLDEIESANAVDESEPGTSIDEPPDSTAEADGADDVDVIDEPTRPDPGSPPADRDASNTDAEWSATKGPTGDRDASDTDAEWSATEDPADKGDDGEDRTADGTSALADRLDRGTDLEGAVDDEGPDEERRETTAVEDLDTGSDPESVATDERGMDEESPRDPAAELNAGLDLEAAATSDERNSTDGASTEEMDLADAMGTGVDVEAAVESTREREAEIGPDTLAGETTDAEGRVESETVEQPRVDAEIGSETDAPDVSVGSVRPEIGIAGHTALDREEAVDWPSGAVGSKARVPDAAVGGGDRADNDTDDRSRRSASFSAETLLAAQRTAMVGSTSLFAQGIAIQRALSGATLSALEGSVALQRLGLDAVRAGTRASRRAVAEQTETGTETSGAHGRGRSASLASAVSDLYAAHAQLLDVVEQELEAGIDAVDELADDQIDALTAGTDLLLAADRELRDEKTGSPDSRDLERLLDRTRTVYARLDEQFEVGRHDATEDLPAQREELERYLQ